MRTSEEAAINDSLPIETIQEILLEHSVQLAFLFGSQANEDANSQSDIDIAVEFDTVRPTDSAYNEVFFGLSADLSEALETDNVDLVDIQTATPELTETIFNDGILLIGDPEHVADIRSQLTATETKARSPRERFDRAVAKIDRHLSKSAVTATDGETRD